MYRRTTNNASNEVLVFVLVIFNFISTQFHEFLSSNQRAGVPAAGRRAGSAAAAQAVRVPDVPVRRALRTRGRSQRGAASGPAARLLPLQFAALPCRYAAERVH